MTTKLDYVKLFLTDAMYYLENTLNLTVDHIGNKSKVTKITDNDNRILVSNPELLFVDPERKRYEYLYDLEILSDDEDNINGIINNLIDNIHAFNTRNNIYQSTLTVDFEDDFDANNVNAVPAGWTIVQSTSGTDAQACYVMEFAGHPKCVHFEIQIGVDINIPFNIYMYKNGITGLSKGIFKVSISLDEPTSQEIRKYFEIKLMDSDGNEGVLLGFDATTLNKLMTKESGVQTDIETLSYDTWYDIEIRFDCNESTFSLYIDDALKGTYDFNSSLMASVNEIRIGYDENGGLDKRFMYVDDIELSSYDTYSRPSDMVFIELFPQGSITYNAKTQKFTGNYKIKVEWGTS